MHSRSKRIVLRLCYITLVFVISSETANAQAAASGRAMTPADLLTRVALRDTAISPDGNWAALVVERPMKVGESYSRGYLRGLDRADIWLASTDGKTLLNVTRGERIRAGHWSPVWSPDSQRLAMVSSRGGDNVRAYIYDLNTKRLRPCITEGVDLGLSIELPDTKASTIAWLSPNQLVLGVLPPGVRPLDLDELERTPRKVIKAIDDVKGGRRVTASILDTEQPDRSAVEPKYVALTVVDAVSNKTRVLTRLPYIEIRITQRLVSISPDRAYAATLVTDYPRPVAPGKRPTNEELHPIRLGVAALDQPNRTPVWVQNVRPVTFGLGATPTRIRWAPSGSTFAFIGMPVNEVQPAPGAFTVLAQQKEPKAVSALQYDAAAPDAQFLTAEDIQWTNNGELLIYGYAGTSASLQAEVSRKDIGNFARDNIRDTARRDWWIIFSPVAFHNLTREVSQSPRVLFKSRGSNVMFGAAGGRLWTVDPGARRVRASKAGDTALASIVWPRAAEAYQPTGNLVVSYARDNGSDLVRLDVSAGDAVPSSLGTIPRGAVFTGYSQSRHLIAYETEINELRIFDGHSQREPVTLVTLNQQLAAIAKPQYRTVAYKTADGQSFSGALLLPYGYTPGRRYPMIVLVYGGSLAPAGDWANPYKSVSRGYLDPLILSGHGYAVLVPSVPLESMGKASDPMLDMDKGVKPAIEKVVEMGIADADRIGVMGHSYGGYAVYGLVTQTKTFKAAVAWAGVTDLLSFYGGLDSRYRLSDLAYPWSRPFALEAQQFRMGVPPWQDLDRYLRNSPYVHADKVTTPLLMIHGDLDSSPASQAEQFFVALNRLGKRAKLVRYLGEGHVVESPSNLLDLWEQILTWFDQFLQNPQTNQSAKH